MTRDQEKRTENVEIAHPSVRREPEQLISNCPKKMVVENSNFTILHYWYEYPNKKNATPSNYNLLLNREFL